jgi:serine/threonine-protein phosphatase 2B regulatory subunit
MAPKSKKADAAAARKPKVTVISPEDRATLLNETLFDDKELKALMAMYTRMVTDPTEEPPVETLRNMPEASTHPLFQRVMQLYNTDNTGFISFSEFVRAMSSLSPRATLEERLKLIFSLFDMNQSGFLESIELFQLLRMMMGTTHDDRDLQAICDMYERRFPDGLTYEVFCDLIDVADVDKLTLNL